MVGCACYHIVGDSLIHDSQETNFMLRTTSSMVKIVKQKHEVSNILPSCSNALASYVFIELFDFS